MVSPESTSTNEPVSSDATPSCRSIYETQSMDFAANTAIRKTHCTSAAARNGSLNCVLIRFRFSMACLDSHSSRMLRLCCACRVVRRVFSKQYAFCLTTIHGTEEWGISWGCRWAQFIFNALGQGHNHQLDLDPPFPGLLDPGS